MTVSAVQPIPVRDETDVIVAIQRGRQLAQAAGFDLNAQVSIATVIAEIARNLITHAGGGELSLEPLAAGDQHPTGLRIIASDHGPGIPDINQALQEGFSTGSGLGLGLASARRLMDEFELDSAPGQGTRITMTKWLPTAL